MFYVILIFAIFFALNMGGASFAASFAAPYGGKILNRTQAGVLFVLFVILGSLLLGKNVAVTLGNEIMPADLVNAKALFIIFLSAGLSMYWANMINIPQSTSLVTVAAIAGVGAYHGQLNMATIYYFVPFWIILPIASYVLTRYIAAAIYPPRKANFWVYQKFINQQSKLRAFIIITSCYNAFSVGTNNVANVVGPLMGETNLTMSAALFLFGIVYGVGAFAFTGPLKTVGNKIVPLGLLTASIISLVSGTLMILASSLGIPQSFVMLQMGALFAIANLKEGESITFTSPIARKTLYTWTFNPLMTFIFSYGLSWVIIR